MDILNLFRSKRALMVGDFMLDVYTYGAVDRISPEAPVPVLRVEREEERAGGAGNAILNMTSLGLSVIACGRVGKDAAGTSFLTVLEKEGVDVSNILIDNDFRTPVKKRMIAEHQQLLRVDYESVPPLLSELEKESMQRMDSLVSRVDVVAISDYAKGFLTEKIIKKLIASARKYHIPVIVDPKGACFKKYDGATLLKPNLGEAAIAAGLDKRSSLKLIAERLLKRVSVDQLMITRSREGISLFAKKGGIQKDFPALVREVKDVTGAGDTVLAMVTAAFANGIDDDIWPFLANVAAGMVVEKIGCARVTLQELHKRLLDIQPVGAFG